MCPRLLAAIWKTAPSILSPELLLFSAGDISTWTSCTYLKHLVTRTDLEPHPESQVWTQPPPSFSYSLHISAITKWTSKLQTMFTSQASSPPPLLTVAPASPCLHDRHSAWTSSCHQLPPTLGHRPQPATTSFTSQFPEHGIFTERGRLN